MRRSNQVLVSFWDGGPSSGESENLVWFLWVLSFPLNPAKNQVKVRSIGDQHVKVISRKFPLAVTVELGRF